MLHPSSCPSRQLDTIDIPQTLPRYTFSLHQFRQLGAKTFGSASPPCMTACSSKASSRLIASIVSSLCGIAIVSTPPFLLHQCCPSSLPTVSHRPYHKGLSFAISNLFHYSLALSQNSSRNALIAHRKSEQDFTPLATITSATPHDVSIIDIRNASNQ